MDEDKVTETTDQEVETADTTEETKDDGTKLIREMRKTLKEQSKELKRFKDAEAKKEEAEKIEQGKYEELLKEKDKKLSDTNQRLQDLMIQQSVDKELSNVKPEWSKYIAQDVKNLLEFDDSGNITNLQESIEQVKNENPDAFRTSNGVIPSKVQTGGETITKMTKEKALEILNSKDNRLYAKHQAEILEALKD